MQDPPESAHCPPLHTTHTFDTHTTHVCRLKATVNFIVWDLIVSSVRSVDQQTTEFHFTLIQYPKTIDFMVSAKKQSTVAIGNQTEVKFSQKV